MVEGRRAQLRIGRYAVYEAIARGGMATVHLGRLEGEAGFARTVAIKRLHTHLAHDPDFATSFIDEARMCARIRHPNVVPTIDVVGTGDELCIVMEYVDGLSLSQLMRAKGPGFKLPPPLAAAILGGALRGLHAAHEATSERGDPLGIVHRDVSPQNILVGADGAPRLIDFGVAKAIGNSTTTETGQIKGKLHYMSPEQIASVPLDRRTDVFAAGTVLWEVLAGQRLFPGESPAAVVRQLLDKKIEPPSALCPDVSPALDAVVLKALERDIGRRFASAADFEAALEAAIGYASPRAVAAFVIETGTVELAHRATLIQAIESGVHTQALAPGAPDSNPSGPSPDTGQITVDVALPTTSTLLTSSPRAVGRRRSIMVAASVMAVVAGATATGLLISRPSAISGERRSPPEPSSVAAAAPSASPRAIEPAPLGDAAAAIASDAGNVPLASASASVAAPVRRTPPRPNVDRKRKPATTAAPPSESIYSRE